MMPATYDLRGAFAAVAAWAPDDDPAEPAPDPSPDDADDAPTDVAGEGEGQESEAPDNPELKKVHDEAARHRVRAKNAEAKAEALADQVRTLTLRIAFNGLAGNASLTDLDAAWKLAADDLRAVEVAEDGTVDSQRLGQIVAYVAERYPYLAAAAPPARTTDPDVFPQTQPSGRPTNGRRLQGSGLDVNRLEAKYPALARRRR